MTSDSRGSDNDNDEGKDLHREFVGMLFALSIGQVAIQAALIINSGPYAREYAASYAHLVLAALMITCSWVGWGRSPYRLSNIKHVFSRDFVELLIDLWLVMQYFFLVMGVETPDQSGTIIPSLANERTWVPAIFGTYVAWDMVAKCGEKTNGKSVLVQRGWASIWCVALSVAVCASTSDTQHQLYGVLVGDGALLFLVFLFRYMKRWNLSDLRLSIILISLAWSAAVYGLAFLSNRV